jgi:hypothetical protein
MGGQGQMGGAGGAMSAGGLNQVRTDRAAETKAPDFAAPSIGMNGWDTVQAILRAGPNAPGAPMGGGYASAAPGLGSMGSALASYFPGAAGRMAPGQPAATNAGLSGGNK